MAQPTARVMAGTLLLLVAAAVASFAGAQTMEPVEPSIAVGDQAPRFSLPYLDSVSYFYLRDYAGPDREIRPFRRRFPKHVVVMSFFASWCEPCRHELPVFQHLARAYAGQPVVWCLVDVSDQPDSARAMLDRVGVRLPVLLDRYRRMSRDYTNSLPTIVVIDREGVVRYLHRGYDPTDEPYAMQRAAAAVSAALDTPVPAGWTVPTPDSAASDSTRTDLSKP